MDAPAEAQVDLDVVRDNVTGLRKHVGTAELMAVVKSDAYGHGMVPVARAALAGGAGWLGVIRVPEALELRAAGLTAPVLCLMSVPGGPHAEAIRRDVDLAAGWAGVVAEALAAQAAGHVTIVGIWSHLACADMPGHASINAQLKVFREALALAEQAGARPEIRHLANTPATLALPQ